MKPELAKRLLENSPEISQFREYVQSECLKLKDISSVPQTAPQGDIALEVIARLRAYEMLEIILAPLLNPQSTPSPFDPKEYVVE